VKGDRFVAVLNCQGYFPFIASVYFSFNNLYCRIICDHYGSFGFVWCFFTFGIIFMLMNVKVM